MSAGTHIEGTFCFVDIAGYTALTEAHGEGIAADLLDDFTELIQESVGRSGRIHEVTGDCSFLVFPDPLAATSALSVLYESITDRQDFPVVRTGLHHGQALLRGNRYFGSTINIAARVAAQAIGGQVLCTKNVADILIPAGIAGTEVTYQGRVNLRNLPEPTDLYEVVLSVVSREYAIDPVCRMQVDKRAASGSLSFGNNRYWFCSLSCVELFAKQPSSYVEIVTGEEVKT